MLKEWMKGNGEGRNRSVGRILVGATKSAKEVRMKGKGDDSEGSQIESVEGSGGRGAEGSMHLWREPGQRQRPHKAIEGSGAPSRRTVVAPALLNAYQVNLE